MNKDAMTRSLRAASPRLEGRSVAVRASLPPLVATTDRSAPVPCADPLITRAVRYSGPCEFVAWASPFWRSRTTGSKVPCLSLIHARAASRPDAMPIDDRPASALLPEHVKSSGFGIGVGSRPFRQRFTCVRLRGSYLTRSLPRLLTRRSPRRLLIAAARADLQPGSARRLREANSHLKHSFSLHT